MRWGGLDFLENWLAGGDAHQVKVGGETPIANLENLQWESHPTIRCKNFALQSGHAPQEVTWSFAVTYDVIIHAGNWGHFLFFQG